MAEFLSQGWIYLASFLFIISIVIVIHEFGHFWVARRLGVRVDAFSLGFGKELIGWTDRGGVRWRLAAFPLGGYVRFHEAEAGEPPDPDLFENKPVWRRAAIVAAGPVANFVFAWLVLAALFMGVGRHTPVDPAALERAEIGAVEDGSPAAVAGLRSGDVVRAVNGAPVASWDDLRTVIRSSAGARVELAIQRGDERLNLLVTPQQRAVDNQFGGQTRTYVLGVSSRPPQTRLERASPPDALGESAAAVWRMTAGTGEYVWRLIRGEASTEFLGGPLRIGQMSGDMAKQGAQNAEGGLWDQIAAVLIALVTLSALLSVSVGLFNLLPIPVLDGGHLLYYAFEAVGRPLTPRMKEIGFMAGLALLVSMMIFTTWNDLTHLKVLEMLGGAFS